MQINLLNLKKIQDYKYQELDPESEVFLDSDFPPIKEKSVYTKKGSKLSGDQKLRIRSEKAYFKRPYEIFKDGFTFLNTISSQDPLQGDISNSYFLAALCAVAQEPSRIKKLFKDTSDKDKGYYEIHLYIDGEKIPIQIDDHLLVYSKKIGLDKIQQTLALGNCGIENNRELWAPLLEKAWAKMNGTYDHCSLGTAPQALRALTGAPIRYFPHMKEGKLQSGSLLAIIKKAFSEKKPIVAVIEGEVVEKKNLDIYGSLIHKEGEEEETNAQGEEPSQKQVSEESKEQKEEEEEGKEAKEEQSAEQQDIEEEKNPLDKRIIHIKDQEVDQQQPEFLIQQEEELEEAPLPYGLNFAILDMFDLELPYGRKIFLIKMRCAQNRLETWQGNWSFFSKKWTPSLLKQVEFTEFQAKQQGVFYIDTVDYFRYFNSTCIAQVKDDWCYSSLKVQHSIGDFVVLRLDLIAQSNAFIQILQPRERLFRGSKKPFQYAHIKYMLGRYETEEETKEKGLDIQYICGGVPQRQASLISFDEKPLYAGTYLLFLEAEWMFKALNWMTVTTYGETKIKMAIEEDKYIRNNILQGLLKSCAQKSKNKETYEKDGEADAYRCASIKDSKSEYGFVYYRNDSKKEATLHQLFVFTSLQDYIIMDIPNLNSKTKIEGLKISVNLDPGEEELIILKRTDRSGSFECSITCYFTYPEKVHMDEILKKGKKTQMKWKNALVPVYSWVYEHQNGYHFLYRNESKRLNYEGVYKFQLKGMYIEGEEPGVTQWTVKLKPGQEALKKLVFDDAATSFGYKVAINYGFDEVVGSQEELLALLKEKGRVTMMDQCEVTMWALFVNGVYHFYFENDEDDQIFRGEFEFDVKNLEIVDKNLDKGWKVELNPKETAWRQMKRIDNGPCQYQMSYGFEIEYIE